MSVDVERYRDAVDGYNKWSRVLDDTLYTLCQTYPDHTCYSHVAAKLWLIGRTYATGIERKVPTRGTQGSSMSQLVDFMVCNSGEIDDVVALVLPLRPPLTTAKLDVILEAHGRFVSLLQPMMRRQQSPRSFASKYLHFHCPIVPVYDSVVTWAIRRVVRWHDSLVVFPQTELADDEYAWYCYRFWHLHEAVREVVAHDLTVKRLDFYLLQMGGGPA